MTRRLGDRSFSGHGSDLFGPWHLTTCNARVTTEASDVKSRGVKTQETGQC